MHASDVWIETLAIFISRRCDQFRWFTVFRSCRRRRLYWFTDCHLEAIFSMNSSRLDFDLRLLSTGKMFVWSLVFFPEPGSTRYSSAPSITTDWSNYETSYNDFFEVYNLYHRNGDGPLTSLVQSVYISTINQTISCDQSFFVLIGQNRLQLMSVMIIHKYVNIHTSVAGPQ